MTAPPSAEVVAEIVDRLTETQRVMVKRPVAGVRNGLFFCAPIAATIDSLPVGLCRPRFEPIHTSCHAARLTPLGLAVRNHLIGETR